jgi:Cu-Zn family superoxide dismutase
MRKSLLVPALLSVTLATACVFVRATDEDGPGKDSHAALHAGTGAHAMASIESRSGSTVTGSATFTETEGGVLVEVEVHHAPPGWHAVHVHEKGDCSAPDAVSAGGHFNPGSKAHGSPDAPDHHAGDLGNMSVDENGEGRHVRLMPELTVADGEFSVRGRALVVHASADDLVTQPTGNAGGRIGCGVIQ